MVSVIISRLATLGVSLAALQPLCSGFCNENRGMILAGTSLHLAPQQLGTFEPIIRSNPKPIVTLENWLDSGLVEFQEAWDIQRIRLEAHGDEQADTVIFLQHEPVYTLGTASDEKFILKQEETTSIPIIRMDRGGEVTYHGPGQLVVYPILDLKGYKADLHWYMRALEQAVLQTLYSFGITDAIRDEETTGVWVQNQKVAAIGVKCRRWITQHGVAINIERISLQGFNGIVPCGLEGRKVTCVNNILDKPISVEEFAQEMKLQLQDVFCMQLCE